MKASQFLIASLLFLASFPSLSAEPDFPLTDDSKPHDGIPKGELVKATYTARDGSLFPGTGREYAIYLPAGLDRSKPAPFMVFQDGVIYQAPTVFDNLIAKKEIPPLIGIFIKPGVVPAANANALPRYNRSYEYDSVTDNYARFLIDEFLPAIQAKHGLNLSDDPNARAIAGNSSGGICAFMVAWHRPDQFRRVFSGVGTYVGIHGADQLPVLVRKYEPKPLRVFLQSGENDNNLYCGDWWLANQMMERSLTWSGYDVNHAWGKGGHDAKHATQIFPDELRWLWKGYPNEPVKANPRGDAKWRGYEVIANDGWTLCWDSHQERLKLGLGSAQYIASGSDGQVFASLPGESFQSDFRVRSDDHTRWLPMGFVACPAGSYGGLVSVQPGLRGELVMRSDETQGFSGIAAVPGGLILSADHQTQTLIDFGGAFRSRVLSSDAVFSAASLSVSRDGMVYTTDRDSSRIRAYHLKGMAEVGDPPEGQYVAGLSRICLSPDQTVLYATSNLSRFVYGTKILADKTTAQCQPFGQLEVTVDGVADARGLCVDTTGWLYVATSLGIQVLDQAGRVNFIIPTPKQPYDVCFGGKDLSELFIACGDTIYKRPTKAHGYISGQMAPIKPPPPKL